MERIAVRPFTTDVQFEMWPSTTARKDKIYLEIRMGSGPNAPFVMLEYASFTPAALRELADAVERALNEEMEIARLRGV